MTIVTFVKSIVETLVYATTPILVRPTFGHGSAELLNITKADNDQYPVVYLDEPIKSNYLLNTYNQRTYTITLFFLNKVEFDFNTDKHQIVIEDMEKLSRQFLLRLEKKDELRKVNSVEDLQVTLAPFDTPCSGTQLKINLTLMQDLSNCLP